MKTFSPTNSQDEFLQNVVQTWVNIGEPQSPTELTLANGILQAMREPAAPPVTLTDQQVEFLQILLHDFQFKTENTNNSSRSQEQMIRDLIKLIQEP